MDDAIAQLVGAGIGLAGAVVGGLATRAGAKAQTRGQIEAVQLQIRSVQDEALWASRQAALVRFVAAMERMRSIIHRRASVARALEGPPDPASTADAENLAIVEAMKALIEESTASLAAVQLAASGDICSKATTTAVALLIAQDRCGDWIAALYGGLASSDVQDAREGHDRASRTAARYLNDFIEEARLYLEGRGAPVVPATPPAARWRR